VSRGAFSRSTSQLLAEALADAEGLELEVLGWSLVAGRVDVADTLVRPSKGV
jgi:hypothetical protein